MATLTDTHPLWLGLFIFVCLFVLFIINSISEARRAYKRDHEPGDVARKYWSEIEMNEDSLTERPYVSDEINN